MSVNKVILLGYVGNDPVVRYQTKDFPIAYFSLATNERYGNPPVETTDWHNIVMHHKDAETAERYIRKGTRLYLEGRLRTREYTDKMKIVRQRTEVIVEKFEILGRKPE